MKNKILFLLVLNTSVLTAQELRFGILGGIGYYDAPSFESSTTSNEKSTFGPYIGAYVDYKFEERFGSVFLLALNKKKVAFEELVTLSYIDLGLLLKMDIDKQYGKGFYLVGGPKVSLLGSAERRDLEIKDTFNGTQFGFLLGAGTNINHFLDVEVLVDADLRNVLNTNTQNIKLVGAVVTVKLELNAMLNWRIPSVSPFKSN